MRALWFLPLAAVLAGCRGNLEQKVYGIWRVDPSTVQSSRLAATADKKPNWLDAQHSIGQIQVTFLEKPHTVKASGFGQNSTGTWSLNGTTILVQDPAGPWPTLVLDPKGERIHATIEKAGDTLQMDLIKAP